MNVPRPSPRNAVLLAACLAFALSASAEWDAQACFERCVETLTRRAKEDSKDGKPLTEKEEEKIRLKCKDVCKS